MKLFIVILLAGYLCSTSAFFQPTAFEKVSIGPDVSKRSIEAAKFIKRDDDDKNDDDDDDKKGRGGSKGGGDGIGAGVSQVGNSGKTGDKGLAVGANTGTVVNLNIDSSMLQGKKEETKSKPK